MPDLLSAIDWHVLGVLAGAALSAAGLADSWRQASAAVERADGDIASAVRLAEREQADLEARPEVIAATSEAIHRASEERYRAAGLIRPSRDNVQHLPLLYAQLRAKESRPTVRRGVIIAGLGAALSLVSGLLDR